MKFYLLLFCSLIIFISCNKNVDCVEFEYGVPLKYDLELTPVSGTIIFKNSTNISAMKDFDTTQIKVLYKINSFLTPWPIISHNGRRVGINDSNNDILGTYEFDIDDGNNLNLILTPKGDLSEGVIGWNEETGYLCVIKNIDNNDEIYTMTDSTNLKNYTNHIAWDDFPVADSQGNIYFFSTREEGKNEEKSFVTIYRVDKNGDELTKILDLNEYKVKDFGCKHNGNFPAISPDDKYLVFNLDRDLYSYDLKEDELINITNTNDLYEAFAFFNPHDSERVYFSLRAGDGSGFCSVKIDGAEVQRHSWGNHSFGKFKN